MQCSLSFPALSVFNQAEPNLDCTFQILKTGTVFCAKIRSYYRDAWQPTLTLSKF